MLNESVKIKNVKLQIGQLIKVLRKKNKLSQEDLAQLLDLSRITIQNLESGKNFTIDTLLKVTQHFDLLDVLYQQLNEQLNEQKNLKSFY
ncbi:MAG: helix-turn-helix transcriptional regulator [Flavobacteriales bacterium]|nr:helix-turn-helix transcriptional regulator [Flavobacteriales bacterium]MCB9175071.1 helix-turn-helix transcriptional regulator [Flavobacteriales bacterium]